MGIAADLSYVVLAALAGGFFAWWCRQPLLIGYIVAGVIVGPHTGGPTVQAIQDMEMLAEVGVALLLFTLGLEFSFRELKRLWRVTLVATPIQILFTLGIVSAVSQILGWSKTDSLWLGAAFSLSSTMIVIKTLAARNKIDTPVGRTMLGVLIAQDLAVVPLMLIMPQLSQAEPNLTGLFFSLCKSGLFLVLLWIGGTRVFPTVFGYVARLRSRELFFLATLAVALGAGLLAHAVGMSFALGAFLAGMVLCDTDFNHQALSDVAGLRDLFGLIFFVSVGMLFDPRFFWEHRFEVLGFVVLAIGSKVVITAGLLWLLGIGRSISWKAGFGLAQVGEFAFVLATAGSRSGQLSPSAYSLLISVAVVSMIMTPALFAFGRFLANRKESIVTVTEPWEEKLHNHVVIIGAGFVGGSIAEALQKLGHPVVVVDDDYDNVTQLRERGIPVVFGNGARREVLDAIHAKEAKVALLAMRAEQDLLHVLRTLHGSLPGLHSIVRMEELDSRDQLKSFSRVDVVEPQREVAREMFYKALIHLGVGEEAANVAMHETFT
jgi:CPA2 family monovalent cation:H+ antiporter-2